MDGSNQSLLTEALEFLRDGEIAVAKALFSTVLAEEPDHALANAHMGMLAYAGGDLPAAEGFLRRASIAAPLEASLHNNLGVVRKALGDGRSREFLEHLVALGPAAAVVHHDDADALVGVLAHARMVDRVRRARAPNRRSPASACRRG